MQVRCSVSPRALFAGVSSVSIEDIPLPLKGHD